MASTTSETTESPQARNAIPKNASAISCSATRSQPFAMVRQAVPATSEDASSAPWRRRVSSPPSLFQGGISTVRPSRIGLGKYVVSDVTQWDQLALENVSSSRRRSHNGVDTERLNCNVVALMSNQDLYPVMACQCL